MQNNILNKRSNRSPFWDNYKGFLIMLVVVGHSLYAYNSEYPAEYLVKLIYLFHMPAFIFVSGYLSKVKVPFDYKAVLELFISYFLINTLMMSYSVFVLGNSLNLIKPYYSCWYLIALIIWRITLPCLSKCKYVFVMSVILALVIGFTDEICNEFALARTIAFYPFFIGGYKCAQSDRLGILVDKLKSGGFFMSLLSFVFMIAVMLIGAFIIRDMGISLNDEMMVAYGDGFWHDAFIRIVVMIIAFIMIISLLCFTPDKRIPLITKWGKNSLIIYLFHRIAVLLYAKAFPASDFQNEFIIYALVFSFVLLVILGLDCFNEVYKKFVSFTADIILADSNERSIIVKKNGIKIVFFMVIVIAIIMDNWL